MSLKVLYFGMIAEVTGHHQEEIHGTYTIADLQKKLVEKYPKLDNISYKIAVNQNIANRQDIELKTEDEVALLPPFSGG